MTNTLVPTAVFSSYPNSMVRTMSIIIPPPAPKKPQINPTNAPPAAPAHTFCILERRSMGIFRLQDREEQKSYSQNPGHKNGEAPQSTALHIGGQPASHYCHAQHPSHHDHSVFYVNTAVFCIGSGTCRTGQHIAGQRNSNRLVSGKMQKSHQHGGDYCGGTQSGKSGSQPCACSGQKTDQNFKTDLTQITVLPSAAAGANYFPLPMHVRFIRKLWHQRFIPGCTAAAFADIIGISFTAPALCLSGQGAYFRLFKISNEPKVPLKIPSDFASGAA